MNHNKFKIIFILSIFVLVVSTTFGVFVIKNNQNLSNRFIKMDFDYSINLLANLSNKNLAAQVMGIFGLENDKTITNNKVASSVPVLRYHGIGSKTNESISEDEFRKQMFLLKANGYTAISINDFNDFLKGVKQLPEKSILITFDEGRKDNYFPVDPILKALDFRAVLFINPNKIVTTEDNFYLSKEELDYIASTNRWDIQSYIINSREYAQIDSRNNKGYYISNLIWLNNEKRNETIEEYNKRIKQSLLDSKEKIENLFDNNVVAISFPVGDFGDNSINLENAVDKFLVQATKSFEIVFSEQLSQNAYGFRSNYKNGDANLKIAKRIIVNPKWSINDFSLLMGATQDIFSLYKEDFNNKFRWINTSGDIDTAKKSLIVSSNNGIASVYLDGSYDLGDYEYEVGINEFNVKNTSISLLSKYSNPKTFISCQFGGEKAIIKASDPNNGLYTISSIETNENNDLFSTNTKLKLRVWGNNIQCMINDRPVVAARIPDFLKAGGVGLKLWNSEGNNASLVINNINIFSLNEFTENICRNKPIKIDVGDGTICREEANLFNWLSIYDKYPLYKKTEEMYSSLNNGDIKVAKNILSNKYELSRFEPVKIENIKWTEDPFNDVYWRFNYYNLEPVRNLLYAWEKTGDPAYKDKLIEITESFIDKGAESLYSWDYHGTALRTMTLVDTWWKLRSKNELPITLGIKILESLKIHGDFLADESHFEKSYNHGLDQSASLFLLAVNFPDMPGAASWLKTSSERISNIASTIVDGDGVLVENSPYYHFYSLEKFWEINQYLKQHNLKIGINIDQIINKMINYGTYVLQPNLKIPTIGASLERKVGLSGVYKEIASQSPSFLYALTEGKEGKKPSQLSIQYPIAGQTIMRSGWTSGEYENQTQLIMDVGNYRTDHSDLDALSFNLYGSGIALMPDSGLYTYDAGPYRDYFHGTKSHNTVVVDGLNQETGTDTNDLKRVVAGPFQEGNGYVYQSGQHNLYNDVVHERSIALIENNIVLIFDKLKSNSEHTYEQMFHLFPGAKITTDGLTLTAKGENSSQSLTIRQFVGGDDIKLTTAIGDKDSINGMCSTDYKEAVPCYSIDYIKKGKDVLFVTAINIGSNSPSINFDNNNVSIITRNKEYHVKLDETSYTKRVVEVDKKYDISKIYSTFSILDLFNNVSSWQKKVEDGNGGKLTIEKDLGENILKLVTPTDQSYIEAIKNELLDLSNKNLSLQVKTNNLDDLLTLSISLSNNSWSKYSTFSLKGDIYTKDYINSWLTVGIAKGENRSSNLGNWWLSDPSFDWSKIDAVKIKAESKPGTSATIEIKNISTISDQKEGKAIIIFDDGWASIMDAAQIMQKYGFKGNVGVITSSVNTKNYLTINNLRTLQNEMDWSIVSHSNMHKNAITDYVDKNNIDELENDVVDAVQYLIKNNINSAPNWYIYPMGRTNNIVKEVVGKYYKFARSTINAPEYYPFADPLGVKVFSVYSNRVTTEDVNKAIEDAVKYKQTILLMFHKFSEADPETYTEYSLSDFEEIIKNIKDQNIKVSTLTEFDKENGISPTSFTISDSIPAQLKLDISTYNID